MAKSNKKELIEVTFTPAKTIRDLEENNLIHNVKVEKSVANSKNSLKIINNSKSKSKSGSKSKNNEGADNDHDDTLTDVQSENTPGNFFNQDLRDQQGRIRLRSATKEGKMSSTMKTKHEIQRRKQ